MPTPPPTSDGGMIGVGSGSGSGSGDRLNDCACEDGSVPGSGGCAPSAQNPTIWCCEGGIYLSYVGPDGCPRIGAPTSGSGSGSGSGDGDMDSTQCAPGCRPHWPGDGVCDPYCDVEECGFDLGDCGGFVPTAEECTACTACAPCQACFTDPAACAPGTDLFQTCAVDCAPAATAGHWASGRLGDLCASEKCSVTCAGDACAGCDTDPTKCYPAMGGQPAGEKFESCVAAGCTDCQACEGCLADPTLCAPASPGGSLSYCWHPACAASAGV